MLSNKQATSYISQRAMNQKNKVYQKSVHFEFFCPYTILRKFYLPHLNCHSPHVASGERVGHCRSQQMNLFPDFHYLRDSHKYNTIYSTDSPRNTQSFYLRFHLFAVQKKELFRRSSRPILALYWTFYSRSKITGAVNYEGKLYMEKLMDSLVML